MAKLQMPGGFHSFGVVRTQRTIFQPPHPPNSPGRGASVAASADSATKTCPFPDSSAPAASQEENKSHRNHAIWEGSPPFAGGFKRGTGAPTIKCLTANSYGCAGLPNEERTKELQAHCSSTQKVWAAKLNLFSDRERHKTVNHGRGPRLRC